MTAVARLLPVAALLVAAPAFANGQAAAIDVPAGKLGAAIQLLSRQSGASIGFRDPRLAGLGVRAVRGRITADEALDRMLLGSGAAARQVAPATYLIERARPEKPKQATRVASGPPARQPDPPAIEDIVVTGSKRGVPLRAYPGGVQIIDGGSLSAADGAHGTGAIEARVASVVSTHLGPGRNKLFIRGIADSSFVGPTQATVGQYWGNSRITYSAPDPSLRLYDVRSVEVLEGPQGTLYGAGSLGGVVRVVPRAPDLTATSGSVWAGAQAVQHGDPGVDGGAVLNLPIVEDKLAFRAVGFGSIEGGYIDDTGRGLHDVNRVRTVGGRAALRYEPGDDWTLDLNGVGQRIEGDDSQYTERGSGLTRSSTIAQPYSNEYWLLDFVARKQWDDIELTSSVGYAHQYVYELFEGAALTDPQDPALRPAISAPPAGFAQASRVSMITAETRLARRGPDGTGWLIGLSLLHNRDEVRRSMDTGLPEIHRVPGLEGPDAPVAIPANYALTGVRNRVDEATLYGEASFEPIERLTLTLGGRFTHSRLSGDSEDVMREMAFRFDPEANAARSETRLLPSAALAYRPADDLTLFARYQEGFRPGGIAVRRDFVQRFKGDRVGAVELGARFNRPAFSLALSLSWTRWENIQADLIDGFGFPTTSNVGNGRVLSAGMSSSWRPLPGLEFDAALYLNTSKVTERYSLLPLVDEAASAQPIDFERLPNVADATGRLGFTYAGSLSDRLGLNLSGFARYVGKSTLGIGPILGQLQGDYVDTGLEMRVGTPKRGVSVALTNLLDTRGNRFALGSPFLVRDRNQITPLQPRTIRVGLDLAF
ncbi:MAG TPA: TonB-dependent receptor [Sphingomonadaceae bacterium]|nr:TonB-dependent receptor [Sphingomonadaceae bacterium]